MISSTYPVFSLVVLSAAQSSTVNLFIPFADPQSLVGSIAGSDSTATSYVVNCASPTASTDTAAVTDASLDESDNECGFSGAITVVQGPSTVHYALTIGDVASESINCQLMGSTQAICTLSASGSALLEGSNSFPALTTATLSASDYSFMPVVITAGSVTAKQTGGSSSSPKPTSSATTKTTATGNAKSTGMGSAASKATTASSSSAKAHVTNGAMQETPVLGAGVLGALGVAVAGAML